MTRATELLFSVHVVLDKQHGFDAATRLVPDADPLLRAISRSDDICEPFPVFANGVVRDLLEPVDNHHFEKHGYRVIGKRKDVGSRNRERRIVPDSDIELPFLYRLKGLGNYDIGSQPRLPSAAHGIQIVLDRIGIPQEERNRHIAARVDRIQEGRNGPDSEVDLTVVAVEETAVCDDGLGAGGIRVGDCPSTASA